jgi:hypothetical protein
MGIFAGAAVPAASALTVGPLTVELFVDRTSWAATGLVQDTLTGASYTTVLTATGFETDTSRHGTIIDFDTGTGNPSRTSTLGGFDSSFAKVEYTLTWTSVLGTTGTLPVTCVEAFNQAICSPS